MTTRVNLGLLSVFLIASTACIGTGDALIRVSGEVVDETGSPYDDCSVILFQGGSDTRIDEGRISPGKFKEGFVFHGSLWEGFEVGIVCPDADARFRSSRVNVFNQPPVDLGRVVLKRRAR